VWVEALSVDLGFGPIQRSLAGGNDFAYGGAQTTGTGGFNGIFIRDVDEQVDQFLSTRTVDPGALFVVYAGANDFLGGQTNVNVPVGSLVDDVSRLVAAGARQFLVPNLPLLGFTPRFNDNPTLSAQYNLRSEQFNAGLDVALDGLAAGNLELMFYRLDVAALFADAIADPAAFGLTNVTDAAAPGLEPGDGSYNTSQIAANANEYLFWDEVHPTATVHAVLAERARMLLLGLPGDYNEDDVVDAADYSVWRDRVGAPAGTLANDTDGGVIGQGQYDTWKTNFGTISSSSASLGTSIVPEPTSLLLLVAMAAWLVRVRIPDATI
jgi:lysophospholipase L1-like esterase